jgi:hypothetical protein
MTYLDWLAGFLDACRAAGVRFVALGEEAEALDDTLRIADLVQGEIPGRSGTLAIQA